MVLIPFCDISTSQSILQQIFFSSSSWSLQSITVRISGNAMYVCHLINALLELGEFQEKYPVTFRRLHFMALLLQFILRRALAALI